MIIGPITLTAKVYFTKGEDGKTVGSATVSLAKGQPVSLESLYVAVGQTLAALPDDCRLLNPDEFFNEMIAERTGQRGRFATPANFQYDVEALIAAARNEVQP